MENMTKQLATVEEGRDVNAALSHTAVWYRGQHGN